MKEFSVYQFDAAGRWQRVLSFVDGQAAVRRVQATIAAGQHTAARIIITDGGDFTVFEWTRADGIVWPKPAA